jgi:hypothetical protein
MSSAVETSLFIPPFRSQRSLGLPVYVAATVTAPLRIKSSADN